jgi:hypothetical protein
MTRTSDHFGHVGHREAPTARVEGVAWMEVVSFSALAYGISWAWWAPLVRPHLRELSFTGPLPNLVEDTGGWRVAIGMFGPLVAAILMRLIVSREGLRRSLGAKRPARYYVIALVAPAAFIACVILIDHISSLGRFTAGRAILWMYPLVLIINTAIGVVPAIGEEYGWRGYLLPRLLPLGEVRATALLAVIWAAWHLPILLIGLNYPGQSAMTVLPMFMAMVTLTAFPFTWLFVASHQSVLVVAVMHSALNAVGDTFTSNKYMQGDPLVVGAGGLVSATTLLIAVLVYAAVSARGTHDVVPRSA